VCDGLDQDPHDPLVHYCFARQIQLGQNGDSTLVAALQMPASQRQLIGDVGLQELQQD
jgi:hypothetical protein